MTHRILISAGGTGGHIFPAVALASELKERYGSSIFFAAGKLSSNPYFQKECFLFRDISCSSKAFQGALANCKGVLESIQLIQEFNPDVVMGFGSYYTLPVLMAAIFLKKPLLLHEANSIPGRVNRLFSFFAKKTWIFFPEAKNQLRGSVERCKMPLRKQFQKGIVSKQEALAFFQLNPEIPALLIFGGSQGAKGINALFSEAVLLEMKRSLPFFQIIHLTGSSEDMGVLNQRYTELQIPSYVKPFENRLDLAWAAADIAITRAGASSIAEQYEYGIPGLTIPFPHATDGHQQLNASHLEKTGLGIVVSEKELSSSVFVEKILDLFAHKNLRQLKFNEHKHNFPSFDLSDRIIDWIRGQQ